MATSSSELPKPVESAKPELVEAVALFADAVRRMSPNVPKGRLSLNAERQAIPLLDLLPETLLWDSVRRRFR